MNGTVVVMVGLPARGKTYTAQKIARYLRWLGYDARVFNVGNYRRERLGAQQPHSFFDPENTAGIEGRRRMAEAAMTDLLAWFDRGRKVAIYDATNSSRARRAWVNDTLVRAGHEVMFVESMCNDPEIIEANIRETKLRSPDYADADPETALADFRQRIAHYEASYEPIDDEGFPFVKVVDVGRRIVAQDIRGYLPAHLVSFLMNLHIVPRPIWLTRHGQSMFNLDNRIGGDADLSPAGLQYAERLAEWVGDRASEVTVWTSTLRRAVQTAAPLGVETRAWKALDEINGGIADGMTYAEFRAAYPDEAAARKADKLDYRYPRGESYSDIMTRLDPVIVELERKRRPLLIVGHQAVLRALYGYLVNAERSDIPHLEIPLHAVIEVVPKAYGASIQHHVLGPQVRKASSS